LSQKHLNKPLKLFVLVELPCSIGLLLTQFLQLSILDIEWKELQAVTKEVVGIGVLLTRSLFGGDIPRRLLLLVSLAKLTSAPARF